MAAEQTRPRDDDVSARDADRRAGNAIPTPTRRTGTGPPAGHASGGSDDPDNPDTRPTVWSAGPGSGDTPDRGAGPTTRTARGAADIGADDLGPVTSGDAANTGAHRNTPDAGLAPAGGATLGGNIGDAGADAGDGSIDATDATTVTGDPHVSPAARADAERRPSR